MLLITQQPISWSFMKPLTSIILSIKGREWHFKLFTDRAFDKLHNPNGDENNAAMTCLNIHEVHFAKSDWCNTDIRHEICHVFYAMTNTSSAGHDPLQVEETLCEVFGQHGPEMITLADRVAERFHNYNKD
jgi:hypothetical protein